MAKTARKQRLFKYDVRYRIIDVEDEVVASGDVTLEAANKKQAITAAVKQVEDELGHYFHVLQAYGSIVRVERIIECAEEE